MRTIRISEEVWRAIAERGRFGETEDDVLRRVFQLPADSIGDAFTPELLHSSELGSEPMSYDAAERPASMPRRVLASRRMSAFVEGNRLHIEFQGGAASSWALPDRSDKAAIRTLLDKVIAFTRENGASLGQTNAARKTLTDTGYHLTK